MKAFGLAMSWVSGERCVAPGKRPGAPQRAESTAKSPQRHRHRGGGSPTWPVGGPAGVRGEGAHASSRAWARFGRSSLCLSVDTTGQGCEVRSGAFAGECMHLNQAPHAAFIRTCRTASRRERQCGKSCWRFFRLGEAARSDHFRPRTHGTAGRRARRRVAAAHIDGAHLTWSGLGVGMASMQPCAEERTARARTLGEAVDGCPLTDVVLDLAWDSLASVTTLDELSMSTRCARPCSAQRDGSRARRLPCRAPPCLAPRLTVVPRCGRWTGYRWRWRRRWLRRSTRRARWAGARSSSAPCLSLMVCVAAGGCSLSLDRADAGRLVRAGRLLPHKVAEQGTNLTGHTSGCVLAGGARRESPGGSPRVVSGAIRLLPAFASTPAPVAP